MNRDRLIGVIMIGLILLIVIMFLSHRMNIEQLENQNATLESELENEQAKAEESTIDDEEGQQLEESENDSEETNVDFSNEALLEEVESYDNFVSNFVDVLMNFEAQEEKNLELKNMTDESAQTYLEENYFIIEDNQDITDAEDGERTEGDFEKLEVDMTVDYLDTYYMYRDNNIEVVALYQVETSAGDENFSGNYILKGTLSDTDDGIQFNDITSIASVNDPNADNLFE